MSGNKKLSNLNPLVKLAIAILLLLCLADMPYGFYQLVRFAATAAFAYLSYDYFKARREGMGVLFAALAVLFQPFFKVALGRTLWNAIDLIVAIALFYFIIQYFRNKK